MEKEQKKNQMLQWHPAFFAGIQIEFSEEADKLVFESEHQLGTKPKEIDVLIVKKDPKKKLHKNIGQIFRTYNIVEYKRPGDYLGIDDYYKVLGYACFYKADTPNADTIKATDITISLVCRGWPYKLMEHLADIRHLCLEEQEKGIYYIKGDTFPIQVICTSRLSPEINMWLTGLTNDLVQGELVESLISDYREHQGNSLYKSVMDLIIRANREIFEEEKKMCEALRELFKDELEVGIAAGIEERMPQAVEERVSQIIEGRVSQAIEERIPQAVEERVSQIIEGRMSQAIEERIPQIIEERVEKARQEIRQEGINALIADNLEEGFSVDKILKKLEKRFGLTIREAQYYLEQFRLYCGKTDAAAF